MFSPVLLRLHNMTEDPLKDNMIEGASSNDAARDKETADSSTPSTLHGSATCSAASTTQEVEASEQTEAHSTAESPEIALTPDLKRLVRSLVFVISWCALLITRQLQIRGRNADLEKTLDERRQLKDKLLQQFAEATKDLAKQVTGKDVAVDQYNEDQTDALMTEARAQITQHINLLTRYNEVRDIGLGLMGMLAEERGVRLQEVQEEFGMTSKD